MVNIEEYPFIFMNTPASLQILASAEMALSICRHVYETTSCLNVTPRCEKILDTEVPRRIRDQINKKIASIGAELREWMNFHQNRDLFGNSTEAVFNNCSKHIVADFSGSIGYKATAINILNSGEFNDAVNYKMACTFCLEDQVKRCWPSVGNESRVDVNSEDDECNLSYWNGWMKSGENSITDTALIEKQMETADIFGNDTAFDYFCKMLPDDVRISKIISCLKRSYCGHAAARTLSTLDRVQAEKVFKQEASSIFSILMLNDKYIQFAHQLWTLMGHLVLEDESKFCDVVFVFWKMAFDPDCNDLNYTRCDEINDLLLEIWCNASDELKVYVSDTFCRDQLISFSQFSYLYFDTNPRFSRDNFAGYYGHDMTFLLEVISKWGDLSKEQWWQKNWRGLTLRSKPSYLEQFVRMCLPNDDDEIELFKNEVADFEDLFKSLIEEGFYSELKDYVMFCLKDAEQFQQRIKEVLESKLRLILFQDDDKFAQFDQFVGDVFANEQKDMDEFKSQMISSAECLKNLLYAGMVDDIGSNDFSRVVSRFVTSEDELQQVKRKLFEHCREYPKEICFNADKWQEFLVWCTADLGEISVFKRSLNMDKIFLERLKSYLYDEAPGELYFLDDFLNWYFGNKEDVKNFKLEKVKNYKQIDILRVEIENKFIYEDGSMHKLLKWLFDNDEKNVLEFCESCNCSLRSPWYAVRKNAGF